MKNILLTTSVGCLLMAASAPAQSLRDKPSPDDASVKTTVDSASAFALDLYQQLAKENEGKNLFFSPYSISSALSNQPIPSMKRINSLPVISAVQHGDMPKAVEK